MVREYAKVQDKKDGEWPQFRTASPGSLPVAIEDDDREHRAQVRAKEAGRQGCRRGDRPEPQATGDPCEAVTGKRSPNRDGRAGQNLGWPSASRLWSWSSFEQVTFGTERIHQPRQGRTFCCRRACGLWAASHPMSPSAYPVQMISSTTGALRPRPVPAGRIHGLQRKVLQKAAPLSCRRTWVASDARR